MTPIYTFNDLMNINRFISDLRLQAKKYKVKFDIKNKEQIVLSDSIKVDGYFLEKSKHKPGVLTVAGGREINEWLPILVHESCHMDQWNKKTKLIEEWDLNKCDSFDDWLEGKEYNIGFIKKMVKTIQKIELDCEKRAIAKIKRYKLPIDIEEYIQIANFCLFFYNHTITTRKWNSKILNVVDIHKQFPKKLFTDYSVTPTKLKRIFDKYKN